jgi:hypothetical protein
MRLIAVKGRVPGLRRTMASSVTCSREVCKRLEGGGREGCAVAVDEQVLASRFRQHGARQAGLHERLGLLKVALHLLAQRRRHGWPPVWVPSWVRHAAGHAGDVQKVSRRGHTITRAPRGALRVSEICFAEQIRLPVYCPSFASHVEELSAVSAARGPAACAALARRLSGRALCVTVAMAPRAAAPARVQLATTPPLVASTLHADGMRRCWGTEFTF